ncbi:MAG: MATE family efflux transporter [Candidatus Bathyarchaeia archaeon]
MPEEAEELPETRSISKYRDKIVNGPIIRTFFWLGIPPLVNQIIVVAYNLADAYWLSVYSDVAVAIPRQMWPVIVLFQALLMALTAASLGIVSQYVGNKDYDDAGKAASRFFTLSFISGAVLSSSLLAFRGAIFTFMSTPADIFDDLMTYSGIIAFDIFFNYISLTFTTLLQSVGDTKRPAIVNGIAIGINLILDPFLVLGIGPFPKLGVIGASITDVMGKIISASALAYILREHYPDIKVKFTRDISASWIRLVLRICLPVLALGLTNGFAFLIQLKIINMLGIVAATAFSIGFVIMDIVDAALWGLSGATAIMVGQSLGAENRKRAREVAFKTAFVIFAIMAVSASILYTIRRNVASAFTEDPSMLNETDLFLQTLLPTLPFFGLFIVAMSTGRGSGHTLFPTSLGVVRLWGIRLVLGYLMAFTFEMGSIGAWLAIALSNIVGGTIAILWIKYGGWAEAVIKRR